MKKSEKIYNYLNEQFRESLAKAFKKKFDVQIETGFDIVSMRVISYRDDEVEFTPEQNEFISTYESAFSDCMQLVTDFLK